MFVAQSLLALALGLALSAFFWFPALMESRYGQLGAVTQGYFNYANHFRALDLVQLTPVFNYDVGDEGSTPFAMGLVQTLLVALGVAAMPARAWRMRRITWESAFGLAGLAVSTFMITPFSRPLWDRLPLLPYVQFPWRFLSAQSLFAAVCIGELAGGRDDTRGRPVRIALAVAAVAALTSLAGLRLDFTPVRDADVTPERLRLYEYFSGNIGATIRYEYLPRWTTPRPYTSAEFLGRAPEVRTLAGAATGERTGKGAASQEWNVNVSSGGAAVAFPLSYWPGWEARVDGKPAAVTPAPGLGWITVAIPEGEHLVRFRLARTPVRLLAEFVSFAALAVLAWGGVLAVSRGRNGNIRWVKLVWFGVGMAALIVLALAGRGLRGLLAAEDDVTAPLNMDFDQMAYPVRQIAGFADGSRLATVVFGAGQDAPGVGAALPRGGRLEVGLGWEVVNAATIQLTLVSPAEPLFGVAYTLATVQSPLEPITTASLPIPADVPPGVYFLRLAVFGPDGGFVPAVTPTGRERGALYLAPVWVDDPGGAPASAPIGDFGPSIELRQATTEQLTPFVLRVALDWRAPVGQPENYAIALRLRDPAGEEWAALDTQPAYGLYPTSLWRAGEIVPDRYDLSLPNGVPPGSYTLTVRLYHAAGLDPIGSVEVPVSLQLVPPAPTTNVPTLTDWLGLAGVDFASQVTQGDDLIVGPRWITLAVPPVDAQARWALATASGDEAFAMTLPLAAASSPTTWPAPGLIAGRGRLSLPPDLTPGIYTLQIKLIDPSGAGLSEAVRVGTVTVQERRREFSPPQPETVVVAAFGEQIKLWGFDLARGREEIVITPYWGALTAPGADYKFFVHLTDPAGETIFAQTDDFPRRGEYPTSKWAAGEVVSDTIRLSLADVPPGVYRLSTGWYDPVTLNRLPAVDADGNRVPEDRLVLVEDLRVP